MPKNETTGAENGRKHYLCSLDPALQMNKKTEHRLALRLGDDPIEAGCDEAGRGPLAGPVFAAAVILPDGFFHPLLDDSKKMTARQRDTVRDYIMDKAVAFAIEAVSAEEIDRINILNASIAGMWRAVMSLDVKPHALAVDGNRFRRYSLLPEGEDPDPWRETALGKGYDTIPYTCIIKGDATLMDIAAASVLAKTERDRYMRQLAKEYPQYGWERNMGYPTKEHIEAIRRFGLTPYHRRSFHPKELEPALF